MADIMSYCREWPRRPFSERWPELSLRKVSADSVPHGTSISRSGKYVWAAFHGERLVAVGATADEARHKYQAVCIAESAKRAAEERGKA
ncbi:MAG: hypothetical protein JWQ87_1799 [Candidatus Sulfotelmatobacter sp.]|nr:hypothetical protein [Candidatus Sulfotelmatobacter sp.]